MLAAAAEEAARQNVSPVQNAALAQHLDSLPALFGRCDEQLGHSEFAAAVTTLGAAELPGGAVLAAKPRVSGHVGPDR